MHIDQGGAASSLPQCQSPVDLHESPPRPPHPDPRSSRRSSKHISSPGLSETTTHISPSPSTAASQRASPMQCPDRGPQHSGLNTPSPAGPLWMRPTRRASPFQLDAYYYPHPEEYYEKSSEQFKQTFNPPGGHSTRRRGKQSSAEKRNSSRPKHSASKRPPMRSQHGRPPPHSDPHARLFVGEKTELVAQLIHYAKDQAACRELQQILEESSEDPDFRNHFTSQIAIFINQLAREPFGNYLVQKAFRLGTAEEHERFLTDEFMSELIGLSSDPFGCRVIQTALECTEDSLRLELAQPFRGRILQCIHDPNGNHVIQKMLETISSTEIQFVIDEIGEHALDLARHNYGCRVMQRVIEYGELPQTGHIVHALVEDGLGLCYDVYGNYVVQHLIAQGDPSCTLAITHLVAAHIDHMSRHKYASNVIEKILICGDEYEKQIIIIAALQTPNQKKMNSCVLDLVNDPYGNYVVQRMVNSAVGAAQEELLHLLDYHRDSLSRSNFGKHILASVERVIARY